MTSDTVRKDLASRVSSAWSAVTESVSEGWSWLRRSVAGALTRFRPHEGSMLPKDDDIDDAARMMSAASWALLGGDVFEDAQRVLVRLEAPGLRKGDFDIHVVGNILQVRGEKRFEREGVEGRWRVLQCAYGAFERRVPLPAEVRGEDAKASYRDGVLRIELPKTRPESPRQRRIKVA